MQQIDKTKFYINPETYSKDEDRLEEEYSVRKATSRKPDKEFERTFWRILYRFKQYTALNINDSEALVHFRNNGKTDKRQVDIYAESDESVLFIEASLEEVTRKKIDEIKGKFLEYQKYFVQVYPDRNVGCIFFTKNAINLETERVGKISFQEDLRNNGIVLMSENFIDYINDLLNTYSNPNFAYRQFLNYVFLNRKIKHFNTPLTIPAVKGSDVYGEYYVFNMVPEELLAISSVPHRKSSNPGGVSRGFQRIIKERKIKKIQTFIKNKEKGVFPTNLVANINHTSSITENKISGAKKKGFVNLDIDPTFGLLSIIDGQHRLFAYDNDDYQTEAACHSMIVVVYKNLSMQNQVKLFVDVNEEQTPVSANLLWDLYPEIYDGADPENGYKVLISKLVKELNVDPDSALHHTIRYPSAPYGSRSAQSAPITLHTMCTSFAKQGLFQKNHQKEQKRKSISYLISKEEKEGSKKSIPKDADDLKDMLEFYYNYFNYIKDCASPKHWARKGKGNFYKHNIGMQAIILLCETISQYIIEGHVKCPVRGTDTRANQYTYQYFLKPAINHLDTIEDKKIKDIWGSNLGGGGPAGVHLQLCTWINKEYPYFEKEKIVQAKSLEELQEAFKDLEETGEIDTLEIKESFWVDIKEKNKSGKIIECEGGKKKKSGYAFNICKTIVAFGNGLGGVLVIGVEDKTFEKKGLESTDLKLDKYSDPSDKKREKYVTSIVSKLKESFHSQNRAADFIKRKFNCALINFEGEAYLLIKVKGLDENELAAENLYATADNIIWSRSGESTVALLPENYDKHWKYIRKKIGKEEPKTYLPHSCPQCSKKAKTREEIASIFGWRGNIPQSWCRSCR